MTMNKDHTPLRNMDDMQYRLSAWASDTFGDNTENPPMYCVLGMIEELGELSHSLLKSKQGIRSNEDHEELMKDAVGDIVMFMMDFCSRMGWSLSEIIEEVFEEVIERDWKNNPETGE